MDLNGLPVPLQYDPAWHTPEHADVVRLAVPPNTPLGHGIQLAAPSMLYPRHDRVRMGWPGEGHWDSTYANVDSGHRARNPPVGPGWAHDASRRHGRTVLASGTQRRGGRPWATHRACGARGAGPGACLAVLARSTQNCSGVGGARGAHIPRRAEPRAGGHRGAGDTIPEGHHKEARRVRAGMGRAHARCGQRCAHIHTEPKHAQHPSCARVTSPHPISRRTHHPHHHKPTCPRCSCRSTLWSSARLWHRRYPRGRPCTTMSH
jgi:hypothetical protein